MTEVASLERDTARANNIDRIAAHAAPLPQCVARPSAVKMGAVYALPAGAALEPHPAADLFPPIDGDEFQEMLEDMEVHGQLEPIILSQGQILDGRNRYAICQVLNIPIKVVELTVDDPVAFVVSKNLHRRHLNESQRAMLAAKLANMKRGDPSSQRSDPQLCGSLSEAEAAEKMKVSPRLVSDAKKVLADGTAEEIAAVEKGEARVTATAKRIRKKASGTPRRKAAQPKTVKPAGAGRPPIDAPAPSAPPPVAAGSQPSAPAPASPATTSAPEPSAVESDDDGVDHALEKEVDDLCAAWDKLMALWSSATPEAQKDFHSARGFELKQIGVRRLRVAKPSTSKAARWEEAVQELLDIQQDCQSWLDSMPENLQQSEVAEKLQVISDLDLSELESVEIPRGYGRD